MARRSRPWPAFVDLFSALFITTLAGFMLLTGRTPEEVQKARIRTEVDRLANSVQTVLEEDTTLSANVRRVGDEIVFDLYVHFEKDSDEIRSEREKQTLERVGRRIKEALDQLPANERRHIEITIGGHTDRLQVSLPNPKQQYLYNWNLSALRATSVLYEFTRVGLKPPTYSIVAIGYADTNPVCDRDSPECPPLNRRTTIRLRADMAQIEEDIASGR